MAPDPSFARRHLLRQINIHPNLIIIIEAVMFPKQSRYRH
jgi:hypothetical protein